jgi:hypothetical protein
MDEERGAPSLCQAAQLRHLVDPSADIEKCHARKVMACLLVRLGCGKQLCQGHLRGLHLLPQLLLSPLHLLPLLALAVPFLRHGLQTALGSLPPCQLCRQAPPQVGDSFPCIRTGSQCVCFRSRDISIRIYRVQIGFRSPDRRSTTCAGPKPACSMGYQGALRRPDRRFCLRRRATPKRDADVAMLNTRGAGMLSALAIADRFMVLAADCRRHRPGDLVGYPAMGPCRVEREQMRRRRYVGPMAAVVA